MKRPTKCFITELNTYPSQNDKGVTVIQYNIKLMDKEINLAFSIDAADWTKDERVYSGKGEPIEYYIMEKLKGIGHILYGLILNNKWTKIDYPLTSDNIDEIIDISDYPKKNSEKLDNLFFYLCNEQKDSGEIISFLNPANNYVYESKDYLNKLYFRSINEFLIYLNELESKGFIKLEKNTPNNNNPISYSITFLGLQEFANKQEHVKVK